jgi:hypothetical protein
MKWILRKKSNTFIIIILSFRSNKFDVQSMRYFHFFSITESIFRKNLNIFIIIILNFFSNNYEVDFSNEMKSEL